MSDAVPRVRRSGIAPDDRGAYVAVTMLAIALLGVPSTLLVGAWALLVVAPVGAGIGAVHLRWRAAGVWPATLGWLVGIFTVVVVAAALAGDTELRGGFTRVITSTWSAYDDACAPSGMLARQHDLCDRVFEQRRAARSFADEHAWALFGVALALPGVIGAWLCHVVVLGLGGRRRGVDLAAPALTGYVGHWTTAYVAGGGLLVTMAARGGTGVLHDVGEALGAASLITAGMLLVTQGCAVLARAGLVRRMPLITRIVVGIAAVVFAGATLAMLLGIGTYDLIRRTAPRRSGSLDGRDPSA